MWDFKGGRLSVESNSQGHLYPIRVSKRGETVKLPSLHKNNEVWKTSDNTSIGCFVKVFTPNKF